MTNRKFLIICSVFLAASGFTLLIASQSAKKDGKLAVTYEISGDTIAETTTLSLSSDYEMLDTIKAFGAEGGVQSSTNYSLEVSNTADAQAPSSSVPDWSQLD